MNTLLFVYIFSALAFFYFFIGLYASKNIHSNADYFLASRDLGLLPVTFTLIATQLGGGMLLGTAEKAYSIGYWGILYTLGMSIGFLLLGLGFAAKLQSLNVATTAELFETKYHSATLKKIASLLSIATMCGILVAQVVASKTLLAGLNIQNEYIFLMLWAFIIVYTMVGGLKAVVFTDVAQVWVIILVFGGIFSYSLLNEASSFFSFSSLMATQQLFTLDHQAISTSSLIATIMLPALFSLIEQDLAQRFFAARTPKIAAISAIIASIFLLTFSFIPIYFGMKAKLFGMIIPTGTSPLLPVLEAISSQLVLVLAVCAIIAAITSTADSLLCAVSSNVAQDFDFSFTGIKNQVTISQIVTCITGLTVLGASYVVSPNIIGILISSYEISVSCLFVPLIYSYFSTNLKKNSAIGGIIAGLIGFFLFRFFPIAIPKEIAAIGLSFIGYHLGSLKK